MWTIDRTAFTFFATIAVAAAFAGAATAQSPRANAEERFAAADTDGDGALSLAEIEAQRDSRFTARDLDGDGRLQRNEIVAEMNTRSEERTTRFIERADANGDDALSPDEIGRGDMAQRFARLDANDDGRITPDELREGRHDRQGRKRRGG